MIVKQLEGVSDKIKKVRESETNHNVSEDIHDKVLKLFDSVNSANATVFLNNSAHIEASNKIHRLMTHMLYECGMLQSDDTNSLDVEIDMDCSKDEELARQLAGLNGLDGRDGLVPRRSRNRVHPM
jgi:hypothetical protein